MARTHNTATTPSASTQIVTPTQLSSHATQKDLWIAVHGKVYDLTSFAADHPGGIDVLNDNAGTDGTETFDYAGHGSHQMSKLERYQVGVLPGPEFSHVAAGSEGISPMPETETKLSVGAGNRKSSSSSSMPTLADVGDSFSDLTAKVAKAAGSGSGAGAGPVSSSSNRARLLALAVCALLTTYLILQRGPRIRTSNNMSHDCPQDEAASQFTPTRAFTTGLLLASSLGCAGLAILYAKVAATTRHEMDVFAYPAVIPRNGNK